MGKEYVYEAIKQMALSAEFQKRWKYYLSVFGRDLDGIFGGDYDKKLRLANGLERLLDNKLNSAYNELRHLQSACVTDSDRQILDSFIKLCLNEEEMAKAKPGDWVKKDGGGYCCVIKRTPEFAVIKKVFDCDFVYAIESDRLDGFHIEISDLKTYQFATNKELRKINTFFAENPHKQTEFLRYTDTMFSLREEILKAGFKEAEMHFRKFCFYRCTREKVAFIVNLDDYGDHISVTYGFTSIADQDFLKKYGESNDGIKIRFSSAIKTEQDKIAIADAVKKVYDTYLDKTKDEILALKKERQKEFLQKIAVRLKPLGFKKKGARWIKDLTQDFCLEFEAQKSRWTDLYYFHVNVYRKDGQFARCYEERLNINNIKGTYNWQLMTDEELNCLLNDAIQNFLVPIMNTPLSELGGKNYIWQGCICKRDRCPTCWVQKNLWEANEE
ncbi:MAG: DUF4304 domain-containing protein [Clostridia bacterium]|nr:DUF4304 domain-containing protein [Clostridia bacterium]